MVRVSAGRLRTRLDEHYADTCSPLRIILRKGSYVPSFEVRPASSGSAAPESARPESLQPGPVQPLSDSPPVPLPRRGVTLWLPWLLAAMVVVLLAVAGLGLRRPLPVAAGQHWSMRPFARFAGSQEFADFSPDGKRLVFVSSDLHSPVRNVYVQDLASTTAQWVTTDVANESRPVWSPDGHRIAFLKLPDSGSSRQVVLLDLGTGAQRTVATLKGSTLWLAALRASADGLSLFTSASDGDPAAPCGLVRIDLSTGSVTSIGSPVPDTLGDLEPAVSPDGRRLAFMRNVFAP